MEKSEFRIYESEIYYTYCSYLDLQSIDFKSLIDKILDFQIASCIIENNEIYYNLKNTSKILGFEYPFDNKVDLNFYPIKNVATGEDIPSTCYEAALDSFNHNRLFNQNPSLKFIKVYLEKIFIEIDDEVVILAPNITIFEDGVVVFKYKNVLSEMDLKLDEYIHKHVNLGLKAFDNVYINPFICNILAISYNHKLKIPFYRRFKLLKEEKEHCKLVDENTHSIEVNSEVIKLVELTKDEFSQDNLSTLTQSLLNMFAFLLSFPNLGVKYLLLGQKKIIDNGIYWEGRPYIYLLDFKGRCLTATENNKKFEKEFCEIIERYNSDYRKEVKLGEDVRFLEDASVFFEKSACLKVLSRKSKDIETSEDYILSHEAISTYIEYVYMIHRALLQKITQSHSVDDVFALRWRVNGLASPQQIAASGEVRLYSNEAWGKFGIDNLKTQINEAILISYDEKQFKHEKKSNVVNLTFAILFGLLAIPSVGKDVIAPIWKTTNFYYPANAYENLYFFLVTCLISVIMVFLVLTSIRFFTKEK